MQKRNLAYTKKLDSFLSCEEELVKKIEDPDVSPKELKELQKSYMHLSGYIRYLRNKVERTSS